MTMLDKKELKVEEMNRVAGGSTHVGTGPLQETGPLKCVGPLQETGPLGYIDYPYEKKTGPLMPGPSKDIAPINYPY